MLSPLERVRLTADVWRATYADASEIAARRNRRVEEVLAFVRRNSRFYDDHYADVPAGEADLTAYPPVTKTDLLANLDDAVTDPAITRDRLEAFLADRDQVGARFLDDYFVWTTSGTTGDPAVVVHDPAFFVLSDVLGDRWLWPAIANRGTLGRLLANDFRVALVAVGGGHFAGAAGVGTMQRESRLLRERIRLFSPMDPFDDLVSALNDYRPAIVGGYATVLAELARAQRDGDLDISPAVVVATAEPVTREDKDGMRSAFDCVVRETYGASEFVPIAVECGHGNLHANTDWVVVEPVDENYDRVPPGTPSHTVLVTNLADRALPLVRYDLGDSVTLHAEQCPCGSAFPVLSVGGRQGAVLRFDTDDGEVVVFPLAVTTAVESAPGVRRVQIARTGPHELSVRVEPVSGRDDDTVWNAAETNLREFLDEQGLPDVTIARDPTPPTRDAGSGKYRHVWTA